MIIIFDKSDIKYKIWELNREHSMDKGYKEIVVPPEGYEMDLILKRAEIKGRAFMDGVMTEAILDVVGQRQFDAAAEEDG